MLNMNENKIVRDKFQNICSWRIYICMWVLVLVYGI